MEEQRDTRVAGSSFEALREFAARVVPRRHDTTERLDACTAEILGAFEQAGVEALLLKGRALATLLYAPGEHRDYSDIDLLVAPHDVDVAEQTLASLGYVNADAVRGIDDVGGVVHGQTWIRSLPGSTDRPVVDLHAWLPGARATPAAAWPALMARRIWIEVGPRRAGVLDRAGQAMHLATHAAQHGPVFARHLNELGLALERWPTDVWDQAARLAEEIGAIEVFAAGLRLLPEGGAVASALSLPSTAELDWTIRQRQNRPRGTFHLQALAEAEGPRERLRVLRRSLLPGRAWINHQYPWAGDRGLRLIAAYAAHLARTPTWVVRAWWFRRQSQRAAKAR
jgi:hypothetical protein